VPPKTDQQYFVHNFDKFVVFGEQHHETSEKPLIWLLLALPNKMLLFYIAKWNTHYFAPQRQ